MKIFELEGVGYAYLRKFPALRNISFEVNKGESIVILGANGSGKSTLLKILDALLFPDEGILKAFGREISEEIMENKEFSSFFRKNVALVFQSTEAMLFNANVYEELAFSLKQIENGREKIDEKVMEVAKLAGIENLLDRSPFMLSGGEKRKVAIACVLPLNPGVVLFDEPTANLDPKTKVWFIELVNKLRKEGKTVITATHDLEIAEHIAGRAIIISEEHEIIYDGSLKKAMEEKEILIEANLIHEHLHAHGAIIHAHEHAHFDDEHLHEH